MMGDDFIRLGKGVTGTVGYYEEFLPYCCKIYNLEVDDRVLTDEEQEYVYFLGQDRSPTPPPTLKRNEITSIEETVYSYTVELGILRKLKDNPNIIKICETNELLNMCLSAELRLSIVMEKAETSLTYWLNKTPLPRSFHLVTNLARQLLNGIQAIHDAGFAHLDIKPDNLLIFLGEGEQPILKICDFGNAQFDIPRTFHVVTPHYRPIEIWLELPYWDFEHVKRIDIWSAGCVLHEITFNKRFIPLYDPVCFKTVNLKMITLKYAYSKAVTKTGKFVKDIILKMICERTERASIKQIIETLKEF